jgi:hypothetical protein
MDVLRRESEKSGGHPNRFPTAFGASFLPVSCQYDPSDAALRKGNA